MIGQRQISIAAALIVLLLAGWQATRAGQTAAPGAHPAQLQIRQLQQTLLNSEAESVLGAYIPGVGAVINMELVRGPNATPDKLAADGVRDWLIYLLQTFGTQLTAVPGNEKIIFSVDFYDYDWSTWQQLVLESPVSTLTDPATYGIWLNGSIYGTGSASPEVMPEEEVDAEEPIVPEEDADTGETIVPESATKVETDNETDVTASDWIAVAGEWEQTDTGYRQTDTERFDLVNFQSTPITADTYTITVEMQYEQGEMGGGLIFNAPSLVNKQGAQMVSYTAGGTYLQWGYYDESGIHQFQSGALLSSPGNDGEWHKLMIIVRNGRYAVHLDGVELGNDVPLYADNGQYAGLMISQSQVLFHNYNLQIMEYTE